MTYRLLTSLLLTSGVWIVSGNLRFAIYIMTGDAILRTILYYFHERLWNHISWGKDA
jgi:uncharacterized membrane protein